MTYTAQIEDCPGWWLCYAIEVHFQDVGGHYKHRYAKPIGDSDDVNPGTVAFTQDPQDVVKWIKDGKLP